MNILLILSYISIFLEIYIVSQKKITKLFIYFVLFRVVIVNIVSQSQNTHAAYANQFLIPFRSAMPFNQHPHPPSQLKVI